MSDLTLSPPTIQMSWNYPSSGPSGPPSGAPGPGDPTTAPGGIVYQYLARSPGGTGLPYALDGSTTYFDDENWSFNVRYEYHITGVIYGWAWSGGSWTATSAAWQGPSYYVTVRSVGVTANQTVDSRIDPRYSTYVLKNHQFGMTTYRGGLYAGFNADSSNVGRSYLKFVSLAGPSTTGEKLWSVGGLSLYCTRMAKTGSTSLICRTTTSDTWDPTTLVWGNAPGPNIDGLAPFSISWDSTAPAGQWVTLPISPQIEAALDGDDTLSLVLMASGESGSGGTTTADPGWAYFGRGGYAESGVYVSPYLLYAFGGTGALASVSVTVSPATLSLSSGGLATVTVSLTDLAPDGGATVALSSSSSSVTVPASITIPAGSNSASFTTSGTTAGVTATITATFGSGSPTATLHITP